MVNFVKYTPIAISKSNTSTTTSVPNPVQDLLDTSQSNQQEDTQETASATPEDTADQQSFKWASGGRREPSYTKTSTEQETTSQTNGRSDVVAWAKSQVGSPYVYGAKGDNGAYDCSGLIYAAYKANGIQVPGSTAEWLSSRKQTIGAYEGSPGDVIITGSSNSPSGRHARLITRNLGNGQYACVEAKGKKYGVVESTYVVGDDFKGIYRAKNGLKLIRKPRYEQFK